MTVSQFWWLVNHLSDLYVGSVTSAHRTVAHNREVGGAADSKHLGFRAVDIVCDNWSVKDRLIGTARDFGLFAIDEVDSKNHVHLDDRFSGG